MISEFQIADMVPIAMSLVVAGIGIAYGLNILAETKTDMAEEWNDCPTGFTMNSSSDYTACYNGTNTSQASVDALFSVPYNASTDSLSGVSKMPAKLPIIASVVIAAIIIGILTRYLFNAAS